MHNRISTIFKLFKWFVAENVSKIINSTIFKLYKWFMAENVSIIISANSNRYSVPVEVFNVTEIVLQAI